jgi:hypothetical protein
MRFWFSGPRILGGMVRPGVSFSDRELAGMFASKPTNPLLAMSDAECPSGDNLIDTSRL